jgi:hypothetical protein
VSDTPIINFAAARARLRKAPEPARAYFHVRAEDGMVTIEPPNGDAWQFTVENARRLSHSLAAVINTLVRAQAEAEGRCTRCWGLPCRCTWKVHWDNNGKTACGPRAGHSPVVTTHREKVTCKNCLAKLPKVI